MTIFVKIDRVTGQEIDRRGLENPTRAFHKPMVWLPLVIQPRPPFDVNTEKLVSARTLPPGLSDLAQDVSPVAECVDGWQVVSLTVAEKLAIRNEQIARTDSGIIRGVEDLVETLIRKRTVVVADLPSALVDKINARRELRGQPPVA